MTKGPWPEDPPGDDASAATDLDRFDDRPDEPAGSKGVAVAIAGISVTFGVLLPWLLVGAIYTFLTIYALVKAIGSAPDEPNATVVLVGIVGLVTGLLVILAAGVGFIGRKANAKKRRR